MTSALRTVRPWLRCGALALPLLAALPASAQAPTPAPAAAPNPQLAAAQASFESLPEAERRAIQTDLIWSGHFSGAVTGSYGPLTFRAINALKGGRGQPDGVLSASDRQGLAQQANAARQEVGFRLIGDDRTGVRIGIPEKVLSRREAVATGGTRWQSSDGKVTLDATSSPPGETLEAIFEKATAANPNNPGRKITYKLLRPDFFVVTGETPTGKFYRRLALGPQGLRGFSIGYDKALAPQIDKLVIAIAGSFEPFPSGPVPAAPGAVASIAGGQAAVPPLAPVRPPTERYGVALALSDKLAVTAVASIEGCRSLRIASRPARLRAKEDATGLALLDFDGGGVAIAAPRGEPLAEREAVVLVGYGDDAGKRAAMALPGQSVRIGANPAVFAPLQPGQAGSPVFDRQGRLAGLVTANPSDKLLVAGIAPQRSYAIADAAALQALAGKAGVSLAAAGGSGDLSTGAVVETVGKSVLPIVCGL